MECRDAQFYLRLRRHASDELGPDVTAALDAHCAGCEACRADARAAASFDRAMASAMKAVPVPAGLREKLFTQASAKQGAVLRRKLYRAAAALAAAFLLGGIALGVFVNLRPKPDLNKWANEENSEGATELWLAQQKLPDRLPLPFDYDLYLYRGHEKVEGKDVPFVLFRSREGSGYARVYIFRDDGRFDLKGLQDAQASSATARVVGQDQFRGFTYVVVYTGPELNRFFRSGNGGGILPA